jgi:hypothetical protein
MTVVRASVKGVLTKDARALRRTKIGSGSGRRERLALEGDARPLVFPRAGVLSSRRRLEPGRPKGMLPFAPPCREVAALACQKRSTGAGSHGDDRPRDNGLPPTSAVGARRPKNDESRPEAALNRSQASGLNVQRRQRCVKVKRPQAVRAGRPEFRVVPGREFRDELEPTPRSFFSAEVLEQRVLASEGCGYDLSFHPGT